jgi:hypothetical protein
MQGWFEINDYCLVRTEGIEPSRLRDLRFSYRFGFRHEASFPTQRRLKSHEEQPPAAARARGFAAKNAPAGLRQIRKISARIVRAGH